MKILLSWLREFVDVPGSAEDIATTMSVRGFAVEGIERRGEGQSHRSGDLSAGAHGAKAARPLPRTSMAGPRSRIGMAGPLSRIPPNVLAGVRPQADPPVRSRPT